MTATVPPSTGATEPDPTATRHRKVAIIGSGPAGLTAAIYAGRANLEPLVIAGNVPMGQLMITSDVENYPGFPNGIQGPELMQQFREQAERFGTKLIEKDATKVDFSQRPFRIWVNDDEYLADSVIVATGASALWLGLPTEEEFRGRGVSACATCDGFFFRGRDVAVVGGGDTALEEATFLTRFANKVTMIVRREEFRGAYVPIYVAVLCGHRNAAVDEDRDGRRLHSGERRRTSGEDRKQDGEQQQDDRQRRRLHRPARRRPRFSAAP